MPNIVLPKDVEFIDGQLARGTDVRANDQAIRDFVNNGNVGVSNIKATDAYAWTNRHSFTVSDANNDNLSLITSATMIAGKYGAKISSSAAQTNSALIYAELSNATSTTPVLKMSQAGTGDLYSGIIRGLDNLNAILTSKVATNIVTIANSAVETPFTDLTATLPVNFLKAGTTFKGTAYAVMSTPGAAPATARIMLKYGGVGGTILLDSGAITPTVSLVNSLVKVDFIVTCITTGVAGTIEAQGAVAWNQNSNVDMRGLGIAGTGAGNSATIVVDTTLAKDLTLSFVWGTAVASCSFSWRSGNLELVK